MVHKPSWFKDGAVLVSYADSVGINKDGNALYLVDSASGKRTGEIDDKVALDVASLKAGKLGPTSRWVASETFTYGVPSYYSPEYRKALRALLEKDSYSGFKARSLGSLIDEGLLVARAGHGSPSADVRHGDVPYIKVSDIRAGQVNINPTNMVSRVVAKHFWKGEESGLMAFDLVTPVRASKNIGEFALLMPGQEEVVLTKEVLVLRPSDSSGVDSFFLLWALSLKAVREQWNRVVFMQTNREDVGKRYLEIEVPWPTRPEVAVAASAEFRSYYEQLTELRKKFVRALEKQGEHHIFLGGDNWSESQEAGKAE